MELDVTLIGALIAGFLSFLTPCVLPLVPPYLFYLAGVSLEEVNSESPNSQQSRRVFVTALAFVLGFSTIFISLGAAVPVLGHFLARNIAALSTVAGIVIIIMGLHFLGIWRIGLLYKEARLNIKKAPTGAAGGYIMGLAFAFGWTPCIGPVLAAIYAVAGSRQTAMEGAMLLAAYSTGLGVSFLLVALFSKPFMSAMARFKKRIYIVEKVMGGLLVVTGILFLTDYMSDFSYWLQEAFPFLTRMS